LFWAGQLCAKIDPRPYQFVVDQDKANLAEAAALLERDKVALADAKAIFKGAKVRAKRRAISRNTLAISKNTYEQALAQTMRDEASITRHQAALHAAEINLGYTDIVSPIDGTVVSRNLEMGQTVAAGLETPPLFLIAPDFTVMQVETNVSKNDIGEIKVGDKASFTVEAFPNRLFGGEVVQIGPSPQTIQKVVTYDAVISAPNPDLLLKPGMRATIRILVDRRDDVLRVPD